MWIKYISVKMVIRFAFNVIRTKIARNVNCQWKKQDSPTLFRKMFCQSKYVTICHKYIHRIYNSIFFYIFLFSTYLLVMVWVTQNLGFGFGNCHGEMGLRPVEQGFSRFFANFLVYLMIFQSSTLKALNTKLWNII